MLTTVRKYTIMVRTNFEDRVSKVLRNMNMLLEKRIAAVAAADAASTVDAATTNAQHQATRISASGSTGGAFFTDAQKIEFLTKASSKLTRRQRSSRPAPLTTALEASNAHRGNKVHVLIADQPFLGSATRFSSGSIHCQQK